MSQNNARDRSSIGLIDIATRAPAVLADLPVIARGMLTLVRAQPNFKVSIGKIFQDRAERYGDRIFIRFGEQQLTYREANAPANRYAAVLAARGVGRGDVGGIMLRNSPNPGLVLLAAGPWGGGGGRRPPH